VAKNNFSLNFDGFIDYAKQLGQLGEGYLQQAVDNAFNASKEYVNNEVAKAMDTSRYNFDGTGYSRGKAKRSLSLVKTLPVEWTGTVAKAYVGVRLRDALEVQFIIHGVTGNPHMPKDTNLYNAIKVKGKHKKKVEEIQKEEFNKVIEEALRNG
jgi:hypothetical protein